MDNTLFIAIGVGIAPFFVEKIWERIFSSRASVIAVARFNEFKEPPDLKANLQSNSFYNFPMGMVELEIKNKGKHVAKSLEVNVSRAYLATLDGNHIEIVNEKILVGDLLPRKTIKVVTWTRWPYIEGIHNISLTYENGVAKILFEKKYVQGHIRKFIKEYGFPIFFGLYLASVLFFLYLSIFVNDSTSSNSNHTMESTQSGVLLDE